mgnify:CR=1 FL=1
MLKLHYEYYSCAIIKTYARLDLKNKAANDKCRWRTLINVIQHDPDRKHYP